MSTDQSDTAAVDAQFTVDNRFRYGLRVHQAMGMVAVQANCAIPVAFSLMQGQATEDGCSIDRTAVEIVERRLRFD